MFSLKFVGQDPMRSDADNRPKKPERRDTSFSQWRVRSVGRGFLVFRPVTQEATRAIVTDLLDRTSAGLRPQIFFFDRVSRSSLLLAEASTACGAICRVRTHQHRKSAALLRGTLIHSHPKVFEDSVAGSRYA